MKRSAKRLLAGLVTVATALVLAAVAPAQAASKQVEVADDEGKPATCPLTNSWGNPTNGNCFKPERMSIATGDTVVFKNTGGRAHDVRADDGSFASPRLGPGDTWSYTFDTPGTFSYYCTLHGDPGGSGQAGEIKVSGAPKPSPTKTTATGSGSPPPPAGRKKGSAPRPASSTPAPSPDSEPPAPAAAADFAESGTSLVVTIKPAAAMTRDEREAPASGSGFAPGLAAGLAVGAMLALAAARAGVRR